MTTLDPTGIEWLDRKQEESGDYVERAWPGETILHATLGLNEEATELLLAYHAQRMTRAVLKRAHGTRGTYEDWTDEVRKESADVLLVLLDIARREGFSLGAALIERQAEIEARDPNHHPIRFRCEECDTPYETGIEAEVCASNDIVDAWNNGTPVEVNRP